MWQIWLNHVSQILARSSARIAALHNKHVNSPNTYLLLQMYILMHMQICTQIHTCAVNGGVGSKPTSSSFEYKHLKYWSTKLNLFEYNQYFHPFDKHHKFCQWRYLQKREIAVGWDEVRIGTPRRDPKCEAEWWGMCDVKQKSITMTTIDHLKLPNQPKKHVSHTGINERFKINNSLYRQ